MSAAAQAVPAGTRQDELPPGATIVQDAGQGPSRYTAEGEPVYTTTVFPSIVPRTWLDKFNASTPGRILGAFASADPLAQQEVPWGPGKKPPNLWDEIAKFVSPGPGDYGAGNPLNLIHAIPVIGPGAAQALSEINPEQWPEALGHILGSGAQGVPLGGPVPPSRSGPATESGVQRFQIQPEAQALIDLGKQYGVRLTAGDILQRPGLKNIEVSAEQVPFVGMRSFREAQAEEAKTAAQTVRSQYQTAFEQTAPSSVDDLQANAAAGDERARNVLDKINQAGGDPDRIIQASIGLADWTTRQRATELYDRVQKLAEDNNLGDVPMDQTRKAVNGALEQLRPAKLPNNEVIGILQKVKDSITPKRIPAVDNPFPEGTVNWKQFEQTGGKVIKPDNSYALIRQLHSDLGDRIRDYYQGNNALIGEKGVGYLERAQNALEDDMRNYAENSNVPEIVDAGRTADDYYKTARVPFKNGMLASAAVSAEPDQIYQQFIKAGKGDRAQNFYDALDEKGRSAVRYNMVNKAVEDAINPQSGIFSPQKFFTAMDKLEDAYGVFFKGNDQMQINGFKNLMAHVTRAGQYAENPPTGQRAIPFILGMGGLEMIRNPALIPWTAGVIGTARALFTTEAGRSLLLRMARVKPGTNLMDSLWQKAADEMPKQTPEPPPEAPPGGAAPPPGTPLPRGPAPSTPAAPATRVLLPAEGKAPAAGEQPADLIPSQAVKKAESIVKGIDPEEEKILYHSATAGEDQSIRENWLRPQMGKWVKETLAGATDDPELAREIEEAPGVVYMSDKPDWVVAKVANEIKKPHDNVTLDDIRKHGQLTIIKASKDAPIVRAAADEGRYSTRPVTTLRGDTVPFHDTDLYDYERMRDVPFGVEPGDYFAAHDIEPATTLTGNDLIQYLKRNHPNSLPKR